jgi:hypothetical protein
VTVFYLWACVNIHESTGCVKGMEYLEELSEFKFLCSMKLVCHRSKVKP